MGRGDLWLELSLSYWQKEGEIKCLSYREEDHTYFLRLKTFLSFYLPCCNSYEIVKALYLQIDMSSPCWWGWVSLSYSSGKWKSEVTWDPPSISLWELTRLGPIMSASWGPSELQGKYGSFCLLSSGLAQSGLGRAIHAQEGCTLAGNMPSLPALDLGEMPGWHRRARSQGAHGLGALECESKPGVISLLKVRSRYGGTIVIAVLLLLILEIHTGQCCRHQILNMDEVTSSLTRLIFQGRRQILFPLINRQWIQDIVTSLKGKGQKVMVLGWVRL